MANAIRKRTALAVVAALGLSGLVAVAPASAAVSTLTVSSTTGGRAGTTGVAPTITITSGTAVAASSSLRVRIDSAPSGAVASEAGSTPDTSTAMVNMVSSSTGVLSAATSGTTSAVGLISTSAAAGTRAAGDAITVTLGKVSAAGTYTFTAWLDDQAGNAAGAGLVGAGESFVTGSFTVGGAVASIELSATSGTAVEGIASTLFSVSFRDASNNTTALIAGEQVNFSSTGAASTVPSSITAAGSVSITAASSTAGSYTVTATPGGTLPGSIAAKTYALTVKAPAATAPTDFSTSQATNIIAGGSAGARTATLNTSVTTLSVTASGATANAPVVLYVSDGDAGSVAATGVSINGVAVSVADNLAAGTPVVVGESNASGAVTFTVTTTDTSLDTNKLRLSTLADSSNGSAKNMTVTWATPVFDDSETQVNDIAVVGAAVSLTVKVADQFGNPGANYIVTAQTDVTTSGTGGPATSTKGALVSGTTGAAGTVTLSVAAPAGTVNGTVVNVLYTVTNSTGSSTLANAVTAYAVTYITQGVLTTLTLSANDFDADGVDVAAGATILVPYDAVPSVVASTANTAANAADDAISFEITPSSAAIVSVTGSSADVWFSSTAPSAWNGGTNSLTVGASASGTTVYVWATKVGTHSVTVTAGGKTATGFFKVNTAAAAVRNVALTAPASVENGKVITVTATLTDAFGNVVDTTAGTGEVDFSVTGPGFINGALTVLADQTSDAAGTISFSIVGANSGTGSIVVTATGTSGQGQFAAAAGVLTGSTAGSNGFAASIASATRTVNLIAGTEATLATANAAAIAKVQEQVTALAASVTTLIASLSAQVRRLQTALTNLRKLVRSL